jgi:ABC-type multidrug transport system fused ATPase/permease subunit
VTFLLNISIQIIGYLGYLIIFNLNSLSFFLVAGIVMIYPSKKLASLLRHYVDLSYHENKSLFDNIQKLVDNIYLIKILKKSKDEMNDFETKVTNFQRYQFKNYQYGTMNSILPPFFTLIVLSSLFTFLKSLSFLTLEFVGIILRLFQQLGEFNKNIGNVINSHVHLEKLYMVEKNKYIVNSENYVVDFTLDKNIAINVNDVVFKYLGSDSNIFDGLSLKIKRNTHTILTGPNGAGKSTLLGILSGVFYSDQGKVTTFSNNYGYIGVTPLIISGSLRDNLLYGNNGNVSDQEILDLTKRFELYGKSESINLDTLVDNKSLSSGQMQKVSFIRALLAKVDILILDESTSNLDYETKLKIFKILSELEITVINSTHSKEGLEYDHHLEIVIDKDSRLIKKTK